MLTLTHGFLLSYITALHFITMSPDSTNLETLQHKGRSIPMFVAQVPHMKSLAWPGCLSYTIYLVKVLRRDWHRTKQEA